MSPKKLKGKQGANLTPNAPPGHPRQCQHKRCAIGHKGEQCSRWASRGAIYCKFHGGGRRKLKGMKGLYNTHLRGKLNKLLKEIEQADGDRDSLAGEVDVARVIATQAIALMDKVCNPEETSKVRQENLLGVFRFAQEALSHVSQLVEKMVKINALNNVTLDTRQVAHIVAQVADKISYHVDETQYPELRKILLDSLADINVEMTKDPTIAIQIS